MANRNDLSKLVELSQAQALAINGGGGTEYGTNDDGKCDAASVGNTKVVTSSSGNGTTVSECVAKETKNGDFKFKWDVVAASFPK